ncbi:hypothetical protein ANO11243_001620 [Dothideomycetidae sp. 11243]|nr:hypothetical protein ANO11243_001620 [fungal sp. No.11243]
MSRSRQPRTNHSQDADEERRLWTQIRAEAKKIDVLIPPEEDKPSDAASDERLEALYRENVRISEQIQHMIEGQSNEMNLLDTIKILSALRENAEESMPLSTALGRSASTNGSKPRSAAVAKRKAAGGSIPDDGEDSAAASPRVSGGRLTAGPGRDKTARGSSAAPSVREASVKIEDAESVTSSVEGGVPPSKAGSDAGSLGVGTLKEPKGPSPTASTTSGTPMTPNAVAAQQRLGLTTGAMVFYRNKGRAQEGEGILCRVTSVIGEGKQRRYEIQDADPDPQPGTGEPPAPYRASVNNLIPIPTSNTGLSDLGKGKNVLAQYPDTTTFYKAEVSTPWKLKDMSTEKGVYVRLRFEGEMEEAKETEVERRFVIPDLK